MPTVDLYFTPSTVVQCLIL